MRFGIQLPVQAQSTLMAASWESSAGPQELAAVASACDTNGFDFVGVCDHIAVPRELAPRMTTTWYDTVATLGWLAATTERVQLLSHVFVLAYRHPLATAKAFSTLDHLSGGRVILGVGAGHVEAEFDALGLSFADRGATTDRALAAVRGALRDEWASGDMGQRPRPVRAEGPPIWVGGSSAPALRRAATLGDGWLPQGPPAGGLTAAVATLSEYRERAGLTMEGFSVGGGVSAYIGTPDFEVAEWVTRGSADQVIEQISQLADAGVTDVQFRPSSKSCDDMIDQLGRFGAEVIPAFA